MWHNQCLVGSSVFEDVVRTRNPNEGPSLPFQATDDIAAVRQHGSNYFFFFAPFLAAVGAAVAGASVSGTLPIVMIWICWLTAEVGRA